MRRYCFLLPCGKVGSGHVTTDGYVAHALFLPCGKVGSGHMTTDGYVALMRSSCLVGRWGLGT